MQQQEPSLITTAGRDRLECCDDGGPQLGWILVCVVQGQPAGRGVHLGDPARDQGCLSRAGRGDDQSDRGADYLVEEVVESGPSYVVVGLRRRPQLRFEHPRAHHTLAGCRHPAVAGHLEPFGRRLTTMLNGRLLSHDVSVKQRTGLGCRDRDPRRVSKSGARVQGPGAGSDPLGGTYSRCSGGSRFGGTPL